MSKDRSNRFLSAKRIDREIGSVSMVDGKQTSE